jgi:ATP-dependent DNA helicase RecQ
MENVIVVRKHRLPPIDDVVAVIERHMPPCQGDPGALYGGLAQSTHAGALYIAERTGIPICSTTFWRPDQPLRREDDAKRIRYRYPTEDGGRTLTFVGFQEPVSVIPAGTLLRVSLAHWWRPQEMPQGELRCYVQLSGWFAPRPVSRRPEIGSAPLDVPLPQPELESTVVDMGEARRLLKRVFGFDQFLPLQSEVIENMLGKQDTLAIMPTGSGKSLCYQLPALMSPGLTVVVSPLISLMYDQVEQLREWGVTAVTLNSTLSYSEYVATARRIRQGLVKLLYVAPETLLRPETLMMLDHCQVDCLTIDEAHCISAWGHDFRPEYRQLVTVRQRLSTAVCLAVTATATARVRQDILETLAIAEADEFIASFDRKNLFLTAQPRTDGLAQLLSFLEAHRDQSGIIYCATRRQVDSLAEQLNNRGWLVLPYHAGLHDSTRHRHHRLFTRDDIPIMVATVAFGMGIDKSNVRFVVHYSLPKNIESYYQEIGRAGRDGLQADCLLLHSRADVQTINHFIEQQAPGEQRGATVRLQALVGYAESSICRRRQLLAYFGERYTANVCGMCDNCTADDRQLDDITIPAQKFLSCVKRTGEIFGASYITDVLRGSRAKRILQRRHDQLSTYGVGREFSKHQWRHLARQLIQQGLLYQDISHGSLKLTSEAFSVFEGKMVMGTVERQCRSSHQVPSKRKYDVGLFGLLRAKRKEIADDNGIPPFVIFHDRSLVEMATYLPHSRESFADIHGVGVAKVAKYADVFLPLIREHCQAHDLVELSKRPETLRKSPDRQPTSKRKRRFQEVAEAFNAGQSVTDLAAAYGIKPGTVLNYLWKYAQVGRSLRLERLQELTALDPDVQSRIVTAFAELGIQQLRPVYEALGEDVSFEDLKIIRLCLLAQEK